ncbi:methyltransferase, TIGR04325 family [Pedobacter faecalis]|uniref:methyltransferase, TIGR04325 family n=1 Tax=Pedobacter faecalis TaxID=3041495 RepID=UPI00254BF919|nr:methyltransferase, TIGR04325 family [Pedobacter sp. ELA7]
MFKALLSKRKKSDWGWSGDYPSWDAVSALSGGYDQDVILDRVGSALMKVKMGEAVYERDSALFDEPEIPYSILGYILASAATSGRALHILDFGGSLGSSYFQLRRYLPEATCASWNVVEQPHFVAVGKRDFEDERLKFFNSIEECLSCTVVDLVLLSSVVQYLQHPHEFLDRLAGYGFPFLLFDRTAVHHVKRDRLTLQVVPPSIYEATYPAWFLNQERFLAHFFSQYTLIAEFPSYVQGEENLLIDGKPQGYGKGFYLVNSSNPLS